MKIEYRVYMDQGADGTRSLNAIVEIEGSPGNGGYGNEKAPMIGAVEAAGKSAKAITEVMAEAFGDAPS